MNKIIILLVLLLSSCSTLLDQRFSLTKSDYNDIVTSKKALVVHGEPEYILNWSKTDQLYSDGFEIDYFGRTYLFNDNTYENAVHGYLLEPGDYYLQKITKAYTSYGASYNTTTSTSTFLNRKTLVFSVKGGEVIYIGIPKFSIKNNEVVDIKLIDDYDQFYPEAHRFIPTLKNRLQKRLAEIK